jgi:sulfite exporter TauE/SafE
MNNFWLPFITGLTTGGVSCFAVQGSLLTTALAVEEEVDISQKIKTQALAVFLIAKLIAYTLLGLLLGLIGESLIISSKVQGWFQIFIGAYMLITAANLINLHPFFKHFIIQPPKFAFRFLRNRSKVNSFFTPVTLGALTILIPCGVTQAMMLLAISASNPLTSTIILSSFILGTIPVFFIIGLAANELLRRKVFSIVAALVVAGLGLFSINSGQILRGSVHTIQNYWNVVFADSSGNAGQEAGIKNGVQEVTINVTSHGYSSNIKQLKIGVPVKLTLITDSAAGCARTFTIPNYNIRKVLPVTGSETVEFTPNKLGNLTYTCSMGMYSGSFNIVE